MTERADADPVELKAFVERIQGLDIRCLESSAKVLDLSGLPPSRVTVNFPDQVEYGVDETSLVCKFRARVEIVRDETVIAAVDVEYALLHGLTPGEVPDAVVLDSYIHGNARFIIHPYLREAIQSAVAKIGMGNLVLGVLHRDQLENINVSLEISPGSLDANAEKP